MSRRSRQGPFRIQDINETVSGDLHVKIEEQSGQVQEYDVSTASIPFLTRPGQVRYKLAAGRPQDWDHNMEGGFSPQPKPHGIANGWSLYGGAIGEQDYQALALGLGRDLALLGAFSVDVTHSVRRCLRVAPTATAPFRVTRSVPATLKILMI